MNKISKKIVALATMAAFVLTLVPAAAFAAPDSDPIASSVDVKTDTIATDGSATVDVTIDNADVNTGIVLWVQKDGENGIYEDATFGVEGANVDEYQANPTDPWYGPQYAVFGATAATTATVTISGLEAGTYSVFASANVGNSGTTWNSLTPLTVVDNDISVKEKSPT